MKTGVVTLTYGDRMAFLQPVLEHLETIPEIVSVLVVCNGVTEDALSKLRQIAEDSAKVTLLDMGENAGSARGFKAGMAEISRHPLDYIWLLDDDNLPEEEAFGILCDSYARFAPEDSAIPFCLLSYRPDRPRYRQAVESGEPGCMLGPQNSFLGFHLIAKVRSRFRGKKPVEQTGPLPDHGPVLVAPYGGMFFHKRLLDLIGYPREAFFLYADDHEFSYRITRQGGRILLLLKSVIRDLEVSFHLREKSSGALVNSRYFKTDSENAIYYSVRNNIVFEQNFVDNQGVYALNKYSYLGLLLIAMLIRFRHLWKFSIILRAIRDSKRLHDSS